MALKLGRATARHCISLAHLADAKFDAKVKIIASRAVVELGAPHHGTTCPTIRMKITPWFLDDDGVPTRTVTAVVDETAKPNGSQLENLNS